MVTEVAELDSDMFLFCEHNLQINRTTKGQCYDATRSVLKEKSSKIILADNPIKTQSNFKPGGTGQIVSNHLLGRIATTKQDDIGRWVRTTFRGNHKPVTVYSAYAPTASIPNTAKATNTLQQRTYYEQQAMKKNDMSALQEINNQTPRERFETDLLKDVKSIKSQGHEIILMGDLNDSMDSSKSFPQKLIQECNLVDIWSKGHPDVPEPATYFRGKKRIDHCLVTLEIAKATEVIEYTPFYTISCSDHSGIIIDVNTEKIFPKRSNIQTFHTRGLFSNDFKQLPKYIEKVYDHLDSNNIFKQMEALQTEDQLNVAAIEKIDKTISQAVFSGEKSIRKRQKPWWSVEIHSARYTLNILNKAINQVRKGRYNKAALQIQLDQHQCDTELPSSMSELVKLRHEKRQKIRDIIHQSKERREEFLTVHATKATLTGDNEKATIAKALNHAEKVNRAFKTMASIRKPPQQNGITTIKIPASWDTPNRAMNNPDKLEDPSKTMEWRDVTDISEIQQYMLIRNRKHFHQAYGTPLTKHPWPGLLDWAATSPTAQDILEGRFDGQHLSLIQQTIFQKCKKEFESPLVNRKLTVAEMKGKLKTWRENTSTSPSGRHLGHYRAMIQPLTFIPDEEEREKLETYQQYILALYTDVINYATKYGYTLDRWKTIESTMIPKDPGNTKIHRLRVIHIFEADYNLLLAVKWRELIWQLEHHGGLHSGQHGSRPGHQATDLTLLEELTYDVSKCSRTSLGNFDNDASACYDRVIAEFASLAALSHGHHPSLVKANTEALRRFKYFIRNTTNQPQAYYNHSDQYPIYGTGQGCANSPTVWCLVSSTLFKAHQQVANGAHFMTPDQSVQASFSMVGFVDDSTGRVNQFTSRPQPTASELTQMMSTDAQHWHDALDFSGGKLELPKCSYHLLSYQFKPDGKAIPFESPTLPDLYVKNNNQTVPIKRMTVFQTHKTLGHWKAPCSIGNTNLSKVKQKATIIANQINCSNLSRPFIWLMYLSIYVSAIRYSLPQSFYKKTVLEEAQRTSMRTLIGACGFSRNTPLSVLYGPTHLGGAGFITWFTLQGEGQILNFIQHWRTDTDVGRMLRIAVSWAQHFAGTSKLLINDHIKNLSYVPAQWLLSLREFLKHIQGTIQIYNPPIYPIQRQHDRLIMDIVHMSNEFTSDQIEAINHCRLYMQVSSVSDITDEAGTHLQSGAYHGPPAMLYSTSKWLYPVQTKPDHKIWKHWLKFLQMLASPSRKLVQALGPWLHDSAGLARTWNEYRHKHGDCHYVQQLTNRQQWLRLERIRKTWQPVCLVNSLPLVDLFPCQKSTPLAASLAQYPTPTSIPIAATFHDFLNQQPADTRQFLAHVELFMDPFTILQKLRTEDFNYLVTDGASVPLRTAYGWTLALDDATLLAEGSGPAAGASTSYRAEAYGLHAGLRVLSLLCQFTATSFDELTVFCDNKSIINKASARQKYQRPFPTSTTTAEWDQLEHIHALIQNLQLDISFHHVKGHQDEHNTELSFEAQLNVRADFLAGDYIHQNITPRPTVSVDTVCPCHLQIAETTITSHYRQAIRDAASAPSLRRYLLSFCSPQATSEMIDWPIFSTANQRLMHLRVWSPKFIYNTLPTVTYERSFTYDRPRCATCSNHVDTWIHHLQCPEQTRRAQTLQSLKDIQLYLSQVNTCPELCVIINLGLRTFYLQQDPAFGRHHPLFCSQEKIGWTNFVKGLWHKDWCLAQDAYLKEVQQFNVRSTGTLWAIKIITYLREHIHSRWVEHTKSVHNPENAMSATRKRLLDRIIYLQSQYSDHCPHLSHQFFLDPAATHYSHTTLQNWLNLHGPVIDAAVRLQRQNALLSQTLITTYFT